MFLVGLFLFSCLIIKWNFSLSYDSTPIDQLPNIYSVKILQEFPHYHLPGNYKDFSEDDSSYKYNKNPFTQGLMFLNSTILIESTGLFEGSFIKLIEFPSMKNLRHKTLAKRNWGEGIATLNGHIYQLTWTSRIIYGYSLDLSVEKRYSIPLIGWGLTSDNESRIWATSGSDELFELNVPDFDSSDNKVTIKKVVKLSCLGKPMHFVNEMEYIPETKTIWGNIFQSQMIVEFNPETGKCVSLANLKSIYDPSKSALFEHFDLLNDVLNGIAYHPSFQEKKISSLNGPVLFVTGKRWPRLYKIELTKIPIRTRKDHPINKSGDFEKYFEFYSSSIETPSSISNDKFEM
ncbi:glutamine cyclotransferase [Cryptosporidium sp. chipmunk genotype I]|uniref:glutamine cyclotransferase n=1 Tax=Cryptosporidium sp. chipmunk genotype I TaxID=1280935 RepID=UPI00351A3552|nr:glutamine cyclotransferase [Cryptosporidium sp. chipmunk genotype I]